MKKNNQETKMEISEILSKVDHTLLKQDATSDDIIKICDDAIEYGCASVCIPPSYVSFAKKYVGGKIAVCTVIGFPNGYNTKEVKCFETENAVRNGADEIDMVINIGAVKEGRFGDVLDEIKAVRKSCESKILKVIIETCLLNEEEKIRMCKIVSESGADYIKTSTGFSTGGATLKDIVLMKNNCSPKLHIKAAGGISSLSDAKNFIDAGAERLGTSRIIKIVKNEKTESLSY